METIYLEANMVPAVLRGTYTGKMFRANVVEKVTIPSHAGVWDGGTRETYTLLDLSTGESVSASDNVAAPWDARKDREIVLRPGFAVVRHSIFAGKDTGLTFYVHPSNAATLLPAPSGELSSHEKTVLEASCSLKSSYGGKDRYEMMLDNVRYDDEARKAFPTRAQWDEAKASLIAKGLLNKAGAVTVKGRNARSK